MDLKIDFSELISKIKDLLKEEDSPLCEVETIIRFPRGFFSGE
jgi:hypothetical protein